MPCYYRLNRAVTTDECEWLPFDLPTGMLVREFDGATYGAITTAGTAVLILEDPRFYEVPTDALDIVRFKITFTRP